MMINGLKKPVGCCLGAGLIAMAGIAVSAVAAEKKTERFVTYRTIAEGQLDLTFDALELGRQGWAIEDSVSLLVQADGEQALRFTTREGAPLSLIGKPAVQGGFTVVGPELPVTISNFALPFQGRSNVPLLSPDQHPVFELVGAQVESQVSDSQLIVEGIIQFHPAASELDLDPTVGPIGRFVLTAPVDVIDIDDTITESDAPSMTRQAAALGADVIVGALPDMVHWGVSGTTRAYSVATTSCNLGTVNLNWFQGPNSNHPVIAQNLYRLSNNRFEQIGLSWLKHGFCALQGGICSPPNCQPVCGGCCQQLGPGCSDPYTSSRNGQFGNLGPRGEINAHMGTNLGNHAFATGNTTLRGRIQVEQSDLTVPGALYYVEGQYVAADDAQSSGGANDNNNASYRQVLVNTSTFNISTTGATIREKPAIQVWKEISGANLVTIDIPNEGRLTLGYLVTDNGDGTWHYEYALHNMNSDRGVGSFSVPTSGVAVSNIGFHDVNYHSGEVYSNVDWPGIDDGTSVTWATEAFAQNVNANALRFATVYNFRFDAPVPPELGTITLGMFKPGSPTSVTAQAMVPALDCETVTSTCCDANSDNARDDSCVWCECDAGCTTVDTVFADIGGSFGACEPDGFANLFDTNHALSCFSETNPCPTINLDAGGAFGDCNPDGFCNLFDANHALAAFNGTSACTCPSNPAPAAAPRLAGSADLAVVANAKRVRPGDEISVDVFVTNPLAELWGYQLDLGVTGGNRGNLELVDITVDDPAFVNAEHFTAFNVARGQMLSGLQTQGSIATSGMTYLATYTYRVSKDAAGAFVVDIPNGGQTYLVGSGSSKIEITDVTPAVIQVSSRVR